MLTIRRARFQRMNSAEWCELVRADLALRGALERNAACGELVQAARRKVAAALVGANVDVVA